MNIFIIWICLLSFYVLKELTYLTKGSKISTEEFLNLLKKTDAPFVVRNKLKLAISGKKYMYLVKHKGFIFQTLVKSPLELPDSVDCIETKVYYFKSV